MACTNDISMALFDNFFLVCALTWFFYYFILSTPKKQFCKNVPSTFKLTVKIMNQNASHISDFVLRIFRNDNVWQVEKSNVTVLLLNATNI